MIKNWEEYDDKAEVRCEYCGCTREDIYYKCECCCGAVWRVERGDGVELEGFNNIDVVLEGKR